MSLTPEGARFVADRHLATLGSLFNLANLHLGMRNPSLAKPLAEENLRERQQTLSASPGSSSSSPPRKPAPARQAATVRQTTSRTNGW